MSSKKMSKTLDDRLARLKASSVNRATLCELLVLREKRIEELEAEVERLHTCGGWRISAEYVSMKSRIEELQRKHSELVEKLRSHLWIIDTELQALLKQEERDE